MLRLLFVLSSFAPLFLLWAVKGIELICDALFVPVCLALASLPTMFLILREWRSRSQHHFRSVTIGRVEDQRSHILVYLFAILLPFYRQEVALWRDLVALIVALAFIVYLFTYLNLHYINILFAVRGYRIFTIHPAELPDGHSRRESFVLITRRSTLAMGESIVALRLAHDLYLEEDS